MTTTGWVRLCALLADDPDVVVAVRLACTDPEGYLRKQAAELAVPGLHRPQDAEPWQALLDGLDGAGALAYLDAEDSGMELAEALAPLPRVVDAGADLEAVADLDGDLRTAIMGAEAILTGHGLRLVHLTEEPDACPLVVVPAAHVPEIVDLAARLGHAAHPFT
ncbi:DUF6630 family protein [Ruania albidiflava]|uniref:DUF6630 family protein n=1 Tax=Ruania albidiflava TaxID=366586 RepID=UPI0023F259DD|nr:hypothetical protein [Ruania albidiflava]